MTTGSGAALPIGAKMPMRMRHAAAYAPSIAARRSVKEGERVGHRLGTGRSNGYDATRAICTFARALTKSDDRRSGDRAASTDSEAGRGRHHEPDDPKAEGQRDDLRGVHPALEARNDVRVRARLLLEMLEEAVRRADDEQHPEDERADGEDERRQQDQAPLGPEERVRVELALDQVEERPKHDRRDRTHRDETRRDRDDLFHRFFPCRHADPRARDWDAAGGWVGQYS